MPWLPYPDYPGSRYEEANIKTMHFSLLNWIFWNFSFNSYIKTLHSPQSCNLACKTFSIEFDHFSFYFFVILNSIWTGDIQEIPMTLLKTIHYNQSPHLKNLNLSYFPSPYQKTVLLYIFCTFSFQELCSIKIFFHLHRLNVF